MRTLSALGLFAVLFAAAPTSAQPREVSPTPSQSSPSFTPATPVTPQEPVAQQQQPQPPGTCCCRTWSHGWQYAWRPAAACTQANGSCVSPDHC